MAKTLEGLTNEEAEVLGERLWRAVVETPTDTHTNATFWRLLGHLAVRSISRLQPEAPTPPVPAAEAGLTEIIDRLLVDLAELLDRTSPTPDELRAMLLDRLSPPTSGGK